MRDYKSAVADVLGFLIGGAVHGGPDDVGSLVSALREATNALEVTRNAMLVTVPMTCGWCGRDWLVSVRVDRERDLPGDCPACHNATLNAGQVARRGYSGHTKRSTYADGSPFPVPETQSVWVKCDMAERRERGRVVTPARAWPTWIRKENGYPIEAITTETDAHAGDTLQEYWGKDLVVGAWSDLDGPLPSTTIHDDEATAEAPPVGAKYRRASLTIDAAKSPRW